MPADQRSDCSDSRSDPHVQSTASSSISQKGMDSNRSGGPQTIVSEVTDPSLYRIPSATVTHFRNPHLFSLTRLTFKEVID